jgi:hypothetical protein
MINEHDIMDMMPEYDLTPEEILQGDRAFLLDLELEMLSIEMGWGSYQEGDFDVTLAYK